MKKLFIISILLIVGFNGFGQSDTLTKDFQQSLSELMNDLPTNNLYGSRCAHIGEAPELRLEIEQHIKTKNVEKINNWIFSDNLVKKAYATEALIRLSNHGYSLNENQKEQIIKIKNTKTKIWACNGCNYMKERVKDALMKHSIK